MSVKVFGFTAARVQGILDGVGYVFPLPDGSEVSVVRHRGSYGGPVGLWEAAIFAPTGETTALEGWLSEDGVSAFLASAGVLS